MTANFEIWVQPHEHMGRPFEAERLTEVKALTFDAAVRYWRSINRMPEKIVKDEGLWFYYGYQLFETEDAAKEFVLSK